MPQFDLGPMDIVTTVVVTFWYAWLFNHTGGSVLLTLVAHSTEGTVDYSAFWREADASRLSWTYMFSWGLIVAALLLADRPSWRHAPDSAVEPERQVQP